MLSLQNYILISLIVIFLTGLLISLMGHPLICDCGYVKLWHGLAYSNETSQHLTDWYTFSHLIHGFVFYWFFTLGRKKWGWSFGLGLLLSVLLESGWELIENTPLIMNRYREATVSLDYFGDSVINSIFDILAMIAGFFAAKKLPVYLSLILIVALELIVGFYIRDNLTLNILMLLYPLDFIKTWQMRI